MSEPTPHVVARGYIRVSTERQAESGLSLESQTTRLRDYAKFRGMELAKIYIDPAESATKPFTDRPGARQLMTDVKEGEAILCIRFDRLFRRTEEGLKWRDIWVARKIQIHVLDFQGSAIDLTSPTGKFVLTVMLAGAELERDFISLRVREALAAKRAKYGGPHNPRRQQPPGYRYQWNNQIQRWEEVPDEEQQAFMQKLWEWHVQGMSFSKIRQHLQYKLKIPNKWSLKRASDGSYGSWTEMQVMRYVHRYQELMEAAHALDLEAAEQPQPEEEGPPHAQSRDHNGDHHPDAQA